MKPTFSLIRLCILFLTIAFIGSCSQKAEDEKSKPKPAAELKGKRSGTATNRANSSDVKKLNMEIISTDNPIAGSYNLTGGTVVDSGTISGSALGLILTINLKPNGTGTSYVFSGSPDDSDNVLAGTMIGNESGKSVTYDVVLKR